jgi:hypothetical protein
MEHIPLLRKMELARAAMAAQPEHPWKLRLARVKGKVGYTGIARVSTQTLLDILEIPQQNRRTRTYQVLSRLMAELGWTPVRLRDRTRGGYLERVRGYERDARDLPICR